jgi:uncharacterized membrane protein
MIGNVIAVVLALVSLWYRYRYGAEQSASVWGIMLSGVIVILLLYTGWKGGSLVYRHRVGMHPDELGAQGTAADEAKVKSAGPRH